VLVLGALLVSFHLRQMAAYSFNYKLDMRGKLQEDVLRPYWLSSRMSILEFIPSLTVGLTYFAKGKLLIL
jgi:hypothetical protein